ARTDALVRRGGAAAARASLSGDEAFDRRPRFCVTKDLRHRSMAARTEGLPRDFLLLDLRRVPGAAHECALPGQGWTPPALPVHAQRLRRRGRARTDRGYGELSAAGRVDRGTGRAARLHGRNEAHRASRMTEDRCQMSDVRKNGKLTELI